MEEAYKKQVSLLLDVLPEVAKENCFALHGGTAINLFVRSMPRLSVDIDLTYVPDFLVSVNSTEPDWCVRDFERFPSVQWKLQNLRKILENDPEKHSKQCEILKALLMTE